VNLSHRQHCFHHRQHDLRQPLDHPHKGRQQDPLSLLLAQASEQRTIALQDCLWDSYSGCQDLQAIPVACESQVSISDDCPTAYVG